jgi:hypothetical protein
MNLADLCEVKQVDTKGQILPGRVAQVVESLSCRQKALSSKLNITKKKKKKKKERK